MLKEISGLWTLPQINSHIKLVETGFQIFVSSELFQMEGQQVTNLATYRDTTTLPQPITQIVLKGVAGPAGSTSRWSGTMSVGGNLTSVEAFGIAP